MALLFPSKKLQTADIREPLMDQYTCRVPGRQMYSAAKNGQDISYHQNPQIDRRFLHSCRSMAFHHELQMIIPLL